MLPGMMEVLRKRIDYLRALGHPKVDEYADRLEAFYQAYLDSPQLPSPPQDKPLEGAKEG